MCRGVGPLHGCLAAQHGACNMRVQVCSASQLTPHPARRYDYTLWEPQRQYRAWIRTGILKMRTLKLPHSQMRKIVRIV